MILSIVPGKRLPAGYVKICCKSVATVILSLLTKEATKCKVLAAIRLNQWAGADLNRRHTDFQSIIPLVSVLLTSSYNAFLSVKSGLQVVYKWTHKSITTQYPLLTDELLDELFFLHDLLLFFGSSVHEEIPQSYTPSSNSVCGLWALSVLISYFSSHTPIAGSSEP